MNDCCGESVLARSGTSHSPHLDANYRQRLGPAGDRRRQPVDPVHAQGDTDHYRELAFLSGMIVFVTLVHQLMWT